MSDRENPSIGEVRGYLDELTNRLDGRGEGEDSKTVDSWIDLNLVGIDLNLVIYFPFSLVSVK